MDKIKFNKRQLNVNDSVQFQQMLYKNQTLNLIRTEWPIVKNGIYYEHIKMKEARHFYTQLKKREREQPTVTTLASFFILFYFIFSFSRLVQVKNIIIDNSHKFGG